MPISEFLAGVRSRIGNALLILPSVTAFVFDDHGRMLVARHKELGGLWSPPGGIVEPDEPPAEAVVREVREELGLGIRIRGLIGAYGGPLFRSTYPNGDQVCFVMTGYGCDTDGGTPAPDGVEIDEARWVTEAETAQLRMPTWAPAVLPESFAWWRASQQTRSPAA
ncbi:NUDIX domain-containing protein [Sphaerisporangium perillae]|uniref:NUDIX domain-containing protein n=1 Tax=Sphaerisporangium perillae TaxID=2935860 RepID=UPI00200E4247|nr:NUDIX domain-containing protein [Sphaerisporangium perillae]